MIKLATRFPYFKAILHKEGKMAVSSRQEGLRRFYEETYFARGFTTFADLSSPLQSYRIDKVLKIYIPGKADTVLDLGCAWGTYCFTLTSLCKSVVGVDCSKKILKWTNEVVEKREITNVQLVCSDVQAIGLMSDVFDVIICADLVEHLYPEVFESMLAECKRLLKQKGKLIIWTPNRGHILEILKNNNFILKRDHSHVDYKSMARLCFSLREHVYTIKKAYYVESHLPILCIFERIFMSIFPFLRRRIAILAEKEN